jgi:hypothetical protein
VVLASLYGVVYLDLVTAGMEESTVKHIKYLTKRTPARANWWQDLICYGALFISNLLSAFGGASPFLDYTTEKCDLPIEEQP